MSAAFHGGGVTEVAPPVPQQRQQWRVRAAPPQDVASTRRVHPALRPPAQEAFAQQLHQPQAWKPPDALRGAQLGHSRFGRGAPHICYGGVSAAGSAASFRVYYVRPDSTELLVACKAWLRTATRHVVVPPAVAASCGWWGRAPGQRTAGTSSTTLLGGLNGTRETLCSAVDAPTALLNSSAAEFRGAAQQPQQLARRLLTAALLGAIAALSLAAALVCARHMVAAALLCSSGVAVL